MRKRPGMLCRLQNNTITSISTTISGHEMRPKLLRLLSIAMLLSSSCWRVLRGQRCTSSVLDSAVTYITSAVPHDLGSPGVRVNWNITIPPECIQSIKVNNETDVLYTTTNVTKTEAILSGLPCDRRYNIHMAVDGKHDDGHYLAWSRSVSVHVGVPPSPINVTVTPVAGNKNIDLSWGWSFGLAQCLKNVQIEYQEDGSVENLITLRLNSTSVTNTILQNLKCNSTHNISVRTTGMNQTTMTEQIILLPPRGATPICPEPEATTEIPDSASKVSTKYPTEAMEDPTDDQHNSSKNFTVISEATNVCTYAGAVTGAAVVFLLIVVIAEFAIIQHLRRSITNKKEKLQRTITNTNTESQRVNESPMEEYSERSAEWEEAHIYEIVP